MPTGVVTHSPETWKQIKTASESGVTDEQIVTEFGVTGEALRKRRSREQWVTQKRLLEQIEIEKVRKSLKNVPIGGLSHESQSLKATEVIGDSLARNGEQGSLLASNLALSLLQAAHANPNSLKPLADIYDLTAGMKAVRMAAGMDKLASANISVNLAMFASQPEEKQAWRVSEAEQADEPS